MGHLYVTVPDFGHPPRVELKPAANQHDRTRVSIYFGELGEAWVTLEVEDARILALQLDSAVARADNGGALDHPSTPGPPRLKD